MTPVTVTLINEENDGLRRDRRQDRGWGICATLGTATRSQAGGKLVEDPASPARSGPGDQTSPLPCPICSRC